MLLRRSIALDCLRKTLPPIDEDQRLALLNAPFKGTTLFGGELAKPLLCSLRQQRPLSLILPVRMSDEERVFLTGRALRNQVDGAGDRADPCLPPLSLCLASLIKARHL